MTRPKRPLQRRQRACQPGGRSHSTAHPPLKGVAASGRVSPSLAGVASRAVIAGRLANTPDNLIRWIRDPQGVSPGTVMPNMGVGETDARDIAAYLYTLR